MTSPDLLCYTLIWVRAVAPQWGARAIRSEHLLYGLLCEPLANDRLEDSARIALNLEQGVVDSLKTAIEAATPHGSPHRLESGDLQLDNEAQMLITKAAGYAEVRHDPRLRPGHLLWAVLQVRTELSVILEKHGITSQRVEQALHFGPAD